jgi:N-acetylmuramoyl-L-alanine amidase
MIKMKSMTIALLAGGVLMACHTGKYAKTEKIYKEKAKSFAGVYRASPVDDQLEKLSWTEKEWIASTNFGMRKPNYVMIHHTAQNSTDHTVRTFHNQKVGVSSHYVIGRDGKIIQMVNDYYRAHHAGAGRWGTDTDLNSSSIGIELDNNGTTDPWPDVQIQALIQLLSYLKESYKIPQANFIGHMDYAPTRKIDPSRFPWDKLAAAGFGYWYEELLEEVPNDFNPELALRIIGYDIKNKSAAIKAFKQHYIQQNNDNTDLSEQDLKILYAIYKQFL